MKKFGEKEAWAYPDAQFFRVPPIISGTGKATDFKFGQYIQRVHPNKRPLKISEKTERGQGQSDKVLAALLWQDRPRGTRYQHHYTAATFHPRCIVI